MNNISDLYEILCICFVCCIQNKYCVASPLKNTNGAIVTVMNQISLTKPSANDKCEKCNESVKNLCEM